METRKHIVILAAGDFPSHPIPLAALCEADFVVCCDSAYSAFATMQPSADHFFVVGDGDSLPETTRRALGPNYMQVDEQDYNDLHKAMSWATSQFPVATSRYTILGATGRREDHTLGNLSYLATFAAEYEGIDLEMLTDYGRFVLVEGKATLSSFVGQQVSIFSLTPSVPVSATGLQWPLQQRKIDLWWQATLNCALDTSFTLEGGVLLVFRTYRPK